MDEWKTKSATDKGLHKFYQTLILVMKLTLSSKLSNERKYTHLSSLLGMSDYS
jgi:hypothetical protein